jgi:hypothetical protein
MSLKSLTWLFPVPVAPLKPKKKSKSKISIPNMFDNEILHIHHRIIVVSELFWFRYIDRSKTGVVEEYMEQPQLHCGVWK